jgi:hypothetical protein
MPSHSRVRRSRSRRRQPDHPRGRPLGWPSSSPAGRLSTRRRCEATRSRRPRCRRGGPAGRDVQRSGVHVRRSPRKGCPRCGWGKKGARHPGRKCPHPPAPGLGGRIAKSGSHHGEPQRRLCRATNDLMTKRSLEQRTTMEPRSQPVAATCGRTEPGRGPGARTSLGSPCAVPVRLSLGSASGPARSGVDDECVDRGSVAHRQAGLTAHPAANHAGWV